MRDNKVIQSIKEIEIGDDVFFVLFYVEIKQVDEGIGSYEYWGYNDTHEEWVDVVVDASWDKDKYTDEQNDFIEKYLEDDDNLQSLNN
jgi:hypothetical protein